MKRCFSFARLLVVTVTLACSLHAVSDATPASHADSFSKADLFKADVNKLKDTQLVVSPDMPLPPNQNVLWCGTLQLAWNEATRLVGEKMRFVPPSTAVDLLNASDFTHADLDPTSYVAVADFEHNQVEAEIRAALQKTFGDAASPELIPPTPRAYGPDDFVAYAYLYKNLAFATPFFAGSFNFKGKRVQTFGFDSESDAKLSHQARIYDYQSPDDFIVKLDTKSPADELILARTSPGPTLAATIQTVLDRMKAHPPQVAGPADVLAVPKLNFDLRRDFTELEELTLVPSPTAKIKSKLTIDRAVQSVRFQLNEKGAVLKSEAVIKFRAAVMRPHFQLIFSQPFLILLKQKSSSRPYFALWVGNPSLLIPAKG